MLNMTPFILYKLSLSQRRLARVLVLAVKGNQAIDPPLKGPNWGTARALMSTLCLSANAAITSKLEEIPVLVLFRS